MTLNLVPKTPGLQDSKTPGLEDSKPPTLEPIANWSTGCWVTWVLVSAVLGTATANCQLPCAAATLRRFLHARGASLLCREQTCMPAHPNSLPPYTSRGGNCRRRRRYARSSSCTPVAFNLSTASACRAECRAICWLRPASLRFARCFAFVSFLLS